MIELTEREHRLLLLALRASSVKLDRGTIDAASRAAQRIKALGNPTEQQIIDGAVASILGARS